MIKVENAKGMLVRKLKLILPEAVEELEKYIRGKETLSIVRVRVIRIVDKGRLRVELRAEEWHASLLKKAEERYSRLYKKHLKKIFSEGRGVYGVFRDPDWY